MKPRSIFSLTRTLPAFAFMLFAAHATCAANETDAQRQLREDRERFQREIERQRNESAIQADRARQAAEQQRTEAELTRLRAQQDRQSSELRSLTATTRTLTEAPASNPSPRIGTAASIDQTPAATIATITPDFSVILLPDGNCVVYRKGRPAEVLSPAEAEKMLRSLFSEGPKASTSSP